MVAFHTKMVAEKAHIFVSGFVMNKMFLMVFAGILFGFFQYGCVRYEELPPGTVREINDNSSAILELQEVKVPPPTPEEEFITEYRVGPGDVLMINVPGLIDTGGNNIEKAQNLYGFRVSSSGRILLPLIGAVDVNGMTIEEIQTLLTKEIRTYIKKPMVSVEIREFKSQPLYLLGRFNQPGLHYMDRPTNVLHGISMGNGLHETADLRSARVLRSEQVLPIDVYHLLHNNDMRQNVQLRAGDTIFVPSNEEQQVFVFGQVDKPGPVQMLNGRLNLLQALSTASIGSGANKSFPYDHERVRIIRSLSPTHGQLMVVDMSHMMDGHVMPMPLMNGDIIYVPTTAAGTWNETMAQLLPSLQVIAGILTPFVQIEYLNDN